MDERSKELLFEAIQLLRKEIKSQFQDWKDADDWIFSNLSLTKSEAIEIFSERGDLIYLGSAKDDSIKDTTANGYNPVCPIGYTDCVYDPAYIQYHYPDWYKDLYGKEYYCYDDEDK